jgi:hypothetical protein
MTGRHTRPEPPAPRTPWYVWILLAPPLVTIMFVLAGWWEHYRLPLVTAGVALSILSLILQLRNNRVRKPHKADG